MECVLSFPSVWRCKSGIVAPSQQSEIYAERRRPVSNIRVWSLKLSRTCRLRIVATYHNLTKSVVVEHRTTLSIMETSGASNVQSVHSRRYMSKSQRACDFCRERKSACRIEGGAPCQLCSYYKRQCTFNSSSSARRKRVITNADSNVASVAPSARPDSAGTGLDLGEGGSLISGTQNDPTPPAMDSQAFNATFQSYDIDSFPDLNDSNMLPDEAQDGSHAVPQGQGTAFYPFADWINSPTQLMDGMEAFEVLEHLPVQTGRYCGLTGDMDPYLLRLYRFNHQSVFPFKKLTVRSIDAGQLPIQFLQDIGDDLNTSTSTTERDGASREELDAIVPRSIGERLISL